MKGKYNITTVTNLTLSMNVSTEKNGKNFYITG